MVKRITQNDHFMKAWILAIWLLSLVMVTKGQEKKVVMDPNAQKREVGSFTGVKISGSIELILSQGPESIVAISAAEASEVDKIETEVRGGILYIGLKDRKNWWNDQWNTMNKKYKAYVSAPDIHSIESAGSGNIQIVGTLKVDDLELEVAGSGNVKGSIEVENLEMVQSGSSNIRLSGKAAKAAFNCSGSGNIQCPDLIIDFCEVNISGSGNADLTVEKELAGSLSGSGNIRYKGNAEITEKSISGVGKIRKVNIP
jgi:hypothetical protein